jgi:hypothetical protein
MNLPSQNLSKLPDWRLVRLYFDAYKNSVMQRIFPVVNSDLFEETIHTAYSHPQSNFSLEKASSRACIIAFLAFASRILPSVKNHIRFSPVNKDALAAECQFLLPRVLQEPADLDGAQAVTMLASFLSFLSSDTASCGQC